MAVAALRNSILRHLRVAVAAPSASSPISAGFIVSRCGFSDEVKGSFLDKGEVTDRIITVVKNFQKVDPSKV
jgi:NADH dehydrogenase (ubiquinone) 1 alpha/beta subcomplex 1, acyl-carrier protein